MKKQDIRLYAGILALCFLFPAFAQKPSVPRLVQFNGTVQQAAGRPVAGITCRCNRAGNTDRDR